MSELPEENKNLYVDSKLHNKKNFDYVLLLKYYFETNDNKYTEFNYNYMSINHFENDKYTKSLLDITKKDNLDNGVFVMETYSQIGYSSSKDTVFKLEYVEEKDNYMIFENKYFGKIKLVLDK